MELPKRVFNSPLVAYTNFADGSHVNLIKLNKPYANGDAWAVHETTKSPFCSSGLFKTREKAEAKYKLMVKNGSKESSVISAGFTGNAPLLYKDGRALIKSGRKVVAKIFNRPVFFAGTRFENSFTEFPYSLEITKGTSGMARECKTEAEAIHFLNKYL